MDISQIQIIPVDNGFFIQVVNADGSGTLNPRKVAVDREDLVKQIKELADGLYSKEAPKQTGPFQPPQTPAQPLPPATPTDEPSAKV